MNNPEDRKEQFPALQSEEQPYAGAEVAILPQGQSVFDTIRDSRLGVAIATVSAIGALGLAMAKESYAKTYTSLAPQAKTSAAGVPLSAKPIRAFQLVGGNDKRSYEKGPRTKGSRLEELNNLSIWIPRPEFNPTPEDIEANLKVGIETNKKQLNQETKGCQSDTLNSSVGKQQITLKPGRKTMRVVSQLYDTEQFAMVTPSPKGPAEWQFDCDDEIVTTYTFQALKRSGRKAKKFGEPVTVTNYDGSEFDGKVRESRRKPVYIPLPSKIGKNIYKKYGVKTTVTAGPVPVYPGQTVVSSVKSKSKSWTRWVK